MAAHESIWLCRARALDPEASLAPQEFFFSPEDILNIGLICLPEMASYPTPQHTFLTRLLSLTSEGLVVTGNGKRLQSRKKDAESREGHGWESELGTAWRWMFSGASCRWQTGSYPEATAICESLREQHRLPGALAIGLYVCAVTAQPWLTLHDSMDCSLPGSSVHEIS